MTSLNEFLIKAHTKQDPYRIIVLRRKENSDDPKIIDYNKSLLDAIYDEKDLISDFIKYVLGDKYSEYENKIEQIFPDSVDINWTWFKDVKRFTSRYPKLINLVNDNIESGEEIIGGYKFFTKGNRQNFFIIKRK